MTTTYPISTGTVTDYANNFIYENGDLKFFSTPEGYVEQTFRSFNYIYQYKDHLGNVRLSYKDNNGTLEIIEENNYYPFGLKHKGYNTNITSTNIALKRKFGGKEYQDELGLDWYDITARNYDPALGRWMNIDPLAEMMRRHSPYNYAFNNPIFFIDPDGLAPTGATGLYGESLDDCACTHTFFGDFGGGEDPKDKASEILKRVIQALPSEEANNVLEAINNLRQMFENFDYARLAVGVEIYFGFNSSTLVKTELAGIIGNVAFLNGDDAGYFYSYYGGEAGIGAEIIAAESNIELGRSYFISYQHEGKTSKSTFVGNYNYDRFAVGFDSGLVTSIAGVNVGVSGSITQAVGTHWTLMIVGGSGSIGAGWTPSVMASITRGSGEVKFLNPESVGQPKSKLEKLMSLRKFVSGL